MMDWLIRSTGPACSHCGLGSLRWLCATCEENLSLANFRTTNGQHFGYRYSSGLSAWLHRIKDDDRIELIHDLRRVPCPSTIPTNARLTWIPSDPDLRKRRLFDPGEELAKRLSLLWKRLLIPTPFIRRPYLVPLKRMNRREREDLLPKIMQLSNQALPKGDFPIVLIDDLTTTGASFEYCSSALRSRGLEVHGYSLLRAL